MKKIIIILCLLCFNLLLHAQELYNYLLTRGAAKMALFAHPTNTFDSRNSTVTPYDDYYLLDLAYTDKNSNGYPIHTKIKLGKGFETMYINGVNTIYDNDGFPTFGAIWIALKALMETAKENHPDDYNQSLQQLRDYLGIEPNNWNGATWALLFINFDYKCRCFADD